MDISFQDSRFARQFQKKSLLQKKQGAVRARKLYQRLDDLGAADTLETMYHLPGRFHPLTGDRAGQFALDLDHPYRLILEPDHNPVPRKEDGGIDLTAVTGVFH